MSVAVTVSPLTRIEGHLAVHTETEPVEGGVGHRVTSARCEGEMYRGFEQILHGRDPMDAQQITQRIFGVCPISHGTASIRAQEMAYGIKPNHNGRLLQNLIFAANYLQSHILHFYHLAALDFVDVTAILKYTGADRALKTVKAWVESALQRQESFAAAPLLPRFDGAYVKSDDRNVRLLAHYLEALEMRRVCHEMAAVFGARLPHSTALVPGGVTQVPTEERILTYHSRLKRVAEFVEAVYIPDLLEVAAEFPDYFEIGRGNSNFLAYGAFEMNDSGPKFCGGGVVIEWARIVTLDEAHLTGALSCAPGSLERFLAALQRARAPRVRPIFASRAATWSSSLKNAGNHLEKLFKHPRKNTAEIHAMFERLALFLKQDPLYLPYLYNEIMDVCGLCHARTSYGMKDMVEFRHIRKRVLDKVREMDRRLSEPGEKRAA